MAERVLTDRGRRFCYGLAVARAHGRLTTAVIGRVMDCVAEGYLDSVDLGTGGTQEVAVTKKLAEWQAEQRGKWPPPEEELRRLYLEQGLTHQQIADIYGVSREIVGVKLQRLGLRKKPKAQAESPRRQPDWRDFARAVGSLLEMGGRVSITIRIEAAGLEYRWHSTAEQGGEPDAQQA